MKKLILSIVLSVIIAVSLHCQVIPADSTTKRDTVVKLIPETTEGEYATILYTGPKGSMKWQDGIVYSTGYKNQRGEWLRKPRQSFSDLKNKAIPGKVVLWVLWDEEEIKKYQSK